jgi:cohesin complex subunit SCC1
MFFSQLLVAKRGPLGKLWMAAHGWGKTLTKQVITQTNIKQAAGKLP